MTDKVVDGVVVPMTADDLAQMQEDVASVVKAPFITWKADFWRRATEAEAVKLKAVFDAPPSIRLQQVVAAASYFSSVDPDYAVLRQIVAATVGEERAAALLAAS